MHRLFIAPLLLVTSAPASAQLAGGVMGGVDGKVGSIPAGATGSATTSVSNSATIANDATKGAGRNAATGDRAVTIAADRKTVHVDAGGSVRVAQGSICNYSGFNYDPVYREGHYYCEPNLPEAVSQKVR